MVTSPHASATQCGVDVFARDAFLIVADHQGSIQTISGIGQAAANTEGYNGVIPVRGPRSPLQRP